MATEEKPLAVLLKESPVKGLQRLSDALTNPTPEEQATVVAFLEHPWGVGELKEVIRSVQREHGDLVMRVLERAADASIKDEGAFKFCQASGLLDAVCDFLCQPSNDILLLLNYLTIVEQISQSAAGATFLSTKSDTLFPRITHLATHEDPTIACFGIRFIGNLAQQGAQGGTYVGCEEWNAALSKSIVEREGSVEVMENVLMALGQVGASVEGLQWLLQETTVLNVYFHCIEHQRSEVRAAFLHSMAVIYESPPHKGGDLIPRFFQAAYPEGGGSDHFNILTDARRQYNVTTRMAALHCYHAMARHEGAAVCLVGAVGWLDWLLNRKNEPIKEGLEYKFGAVQNLMEHATALTPVVGEKAVMDLRVFLKLGPFYSGETAPVPATERMEE